MDHAVFETESHVWPVKYRQAAAPLGSEVEATRTRDELVRGSKGPQPEADEGPYPVIRSEILTKQECTRSRVRAILVEYKVDREQFDRDFKMSFKKIRSPRVRQDTAHAASQQ